MATLQCLQRTIRLTATSALVLFFGCAAAPDQNAHPPCADPLDAKVKNSCIVTPGTLWRGAKPDTVAAAALIEKGARTIVNLEWAHDDRRSFETAKLSDPATHAVQYFRLPDWEAWVVLTRAKVDDHVAHFIAITRSQPKPIFVHCRSGQNRTGVMVAAYRVFNGASIDDAIAEMRRYGGIWFKYDADYIRSLTPQRRTELEVKINRWISKLHPDAEIRCTNTRCASASNRVPE
jgi:rhodanese/phosphatase family protein